MYLQKVHNCTNYDTGQSYYWNKSVLILAELPYLAIRREKIYYFVRTTRQTVKNGVKVKHLYELLCGFVH